MLDVDDIVQGVHEVAPEYSVKRVQLFGSYAEDRACDESDVDLLVEFTPSAVSLFTLSSLRDSLEEKLGVSVDLVPGPLSADSFLEVGRMVTLYEG